MEAIRNGYQSLERWLNSHRTQIEELSYMVLDMIITVLDGIGWFLGRGIWVGLLFMIMERLFPEMRTELPVVFSVMEFFPRMFESVLHICVSTLHDILNGNGVNGLRPIYDIAMAIWNECMFVISQF